MIVDPAWRYALLVVAALSATTVLALPPLPEPLTLDDAIALASPTLPAIERARAKVDETAADLAAAEALSGVRLDLFGRLRAIRPSYVSPDRDNNDSRAGIALRTRLYDFGYSEAVEAAARLSGDGGEWRLLAARQDARLAVMRSFFDVILADLRYARDNEAMAGAFLDFDRAGDRHELGTVSDVEQLRLEAEYQAALLARNESGALQRSARSQLAIAMGRPGDLVSDVVSPVSPDTDAAVEYEPLLAAVLAGNPILKALRAEVVAARAAVDAARNDHGPILSGELDAAVYNRNSNTTHPLAAGLLLEVPLLTGGAKDAAVARARAELRAAEAAVKMQENELRQQVLLLWQQKQTLRTRLAALRVRGDYRELYLDRSRALYELEVKTDLGDAMTEISALHFDEAAAEFDWLMVDATLEALQGRLLNEGAPDEAP